MLLTAWPRGPPIEVFEPETSVRSELDELSAKEAEPNKSLNLDSEDSQLRRHLFSLIPETQIQSHQISVQTLQEKAQGLVTIPIRLSIIYNLV